MRNNNWFSLLLLIVIIAGAYFIVRTIQQTQQAISAPFGQVNQANQALQTQVSNLLNPTPTILPDPVTIIHEVRALARLETIQYSVEKVITAEIGGGVFDFLNKDRLLLVAHGTVIAGVDLQKLTTEDLKLDGSVLKVRLPAAEVFIASLD